MRFRRILRRDVDVNHLCFELDREDGLELTHDGIELLVRRFEIIETNFRFRERILDALRWVWKFGARIDGILRDEGYQTAILLHAELLPVILRELDFPVADDLLGDRQYLGRTEDLLELMLRGEQSFRNMG